MKRLVTAFVTSFALFALNAQDQDAVETVETTQEVAVNDEVSSNDDVSAPQNNSTTNPEDCGCGKKK
jgi:hypothetical protein